MKVAVGSDARGCKAGSHAAKVLNDLGHLVTVTAPSQGESDDYPDIAIRVASMVSRGEADRAVLLATSGIGMCIVANKLPDIRASVCVDDWMAATSRRAYDTNVLCLSAEMLGNHQIASILDVWMATEFEGGRHLRRIAKILAFEKELLTAAGQAEIARQRAT